MRDRLNTNLREFSRQMTKPREAMALAMTFLQNRECVFSNADSLGLNAKFLQEQEKTVVVGPFVSASPLSTTFAGELDNLKASLGIGAKLVDALIQCGYPAQQYLTVLLSMTGIPGKWAEANDSFVVPKNLTENKRILLTGKARASQAYGTISITEQDVPSRKSLQDGLQLFKERNPRLKSRKLRETVDNLLVLILNDLTQAVESTKQSTRTMKYLDFATSLNANTAIRAWQKKIPPSVCVDEQYYAPFITRGIIDIVQFTRNLEKVGFFSNQPKYMKVVEPSTGRVRTLKLQEIRSKDLLLMFDNGELITFSQLKREYPSIAPCKELSYVLCLANIVPVLYGEQNNGPDYMPYAYAKQQVKQLGFKPILYRIQPQIPSGYQTIGTVFDFYRKITGIEIEKKGKFEQLLTFAQKIVGFKAGRK